MKLLIVDGHNYLYRAFYAIKGLVNQKGEPTNAIFGFFKMLLKLMREEKPTHVALVFDSGKPSVRTKIYPDYKKTRPPMPDELRFQLPFLKEIAAKMGFAILELEAIEADDIIASLTEAAREIAEQILIASSDKDLFQLVTQSVKVLNDRGGKVLFDAKAVKKKLGVWPEQVVDFLALMGDSSDNVPGVMGVGEKSASMLLKAFPSLDEIYSHIEAVKAPALRRKLAAGKEMAYLSQQLVTCDRDIPLAIGQWTDLVPKKADNKQLLPLLKRFELNSLIEAYRPPPRQKKELPLSKFNEELPWFKAVKSLSGKRLIAIDWLVEETSPPQNQLQGIALYDGERMIFGGEKIQQKSLIKGLTALETSASMLVGWGVKSLYNLAADCGIELTDKIFDVKIASYLINPLKKRYSLNDIWDDASSNDELIKIDEIDRDFLSQNPPEVVFSALSRRLSTTHRLFPPLRRQLIEANLLELYKEVEQPITKILAYMENSGIKVLREKLEVLALISEKKMQSLSQEIYQMAGEEFNLNSSQQLGEILFQKLGLPPIRKTKTGYSTDIGTLEILKNQHPLPQKLIGYRQLAKLKSTYLDTLPRMVGAHDGRIHTTFHQVGTATGRLSSSEPNLQNIPGHSDWGRKVREAFISETDCSLLSADYSQMELRVLAHFSEDDTLIAAFKNQEDIHTRTAADIFHTFPAMVTPQMRKRAKAVNFGVIYGLGAFGLARQLKISRAEAQSIITAYFERYQNVAEFIRSVVTDAKIKRAVRTLTSRRRPLPQIMSKNKTEREFCERAAINSVIQGSSADIIKIAMIKIDHRIKQEGLRSRLLLQIHDELVYEAPDTEIATLTDIVTREMEEAYPLKVPLKVAVTAGKNWATLH